MSAHVRIHGITCPRCNGERCGLCTNTYGTTNGTVFVDADFEQLARWIETGEAPEAIDQKPKSLCRSCLHAPADGIVYCLAGKEINWTSKTECASYSDCKVASRSRRPGQGIGE